MMRNISSPQCEAWPSINRPDCFAVSSSRCPSARMSGCEDEWPTIPPMSALITLIVTIKEHLRYFNWGGVRRPHSYDGDRLHEIACAF